MATKKRDSANAIITLKKFMERYSLKKICKVHSDNGGEFISKEFVDFVKGVEGVVTHGKPYRPWVQGAVEKYNDTQAKIIEKFMFMYKIKWKDALPLALSAYLSTKHSVLNNTPEKTVEDCSVPNELEKKQI